MPWKNNVRPKMDLNTGGIGWLGKGRGKSLPRMPKRAQDPLLASTPLTLTFSFVEIETAGSWRAEVCEAPLQ